MSRNWCHLCDDMIDELLALAVSADVRVEIEDVDASETLEQRWGEYVPVLLDASGHELCHYHLDTREVRAYLAGFPLESAD
ncbi:glutaredoxin family protein [Nitrogeniibacter mangrovi]|uniref:Glutaredoxin family protein n=1 Tax=Nitrogeniibacter mangrovi TaxID=2016596 RepID=A0A6C1B8S3_9RHOO|nr:glutaredoxin family protein [Nitrogeniibacter mangrovi]